MEKELISGYLRDRVNIAIAQIEWTLRNIIIDVFRRNVPAGSNPDDWWNSSHVHPNTRKYVDEEKERLERTTWECHHPIEYASVANLRHFIEHRGRLFEKELGAPVRVHHLLSYISMLESLHGRFAHIRTAPTLLDVKRTLQVVWKSYSLSRQSTMNLSHY